MLLGMEIDILFVITITHKPVNNDIHRHTVCINTAAAVNWQKSIPIRHVTSVSHICINHAPSTDNIINRLPGIPIYPISQYNHFISHYIFTLHPSYLVNYSLYPVRHTGLCLSLFMLYGTSRVICTPTILKLTWPSTKHILFNISIINNCEKYGV